MSPFLFLYFFLSLAWAGFMFISCDLFHRYLTASIGFPIHFALCFTNSKFRQNMFTDVDRVHTLYILFIWFCSHLLWKVVFRNLQFSLPDPGFCPCLPGVSRHPALLEALALIQPRHFGDFGFAPSYCSCNQKGCLDPSPQESRPSPTAMPIRENR